MVLTNELIYVVVFVLCFLGTQGKPSLSLNFPFAVFGGLGGRESREAHLKQYSGKRVGNDSLRMVYFHDQTVAVVELGPKKLLLNCELIEVYEPEEALKSLGELQSISRPIAITFKEMLTLMSQCQQVETYNDSSHKETTVRSRGPGYGKGLLSNNPLTLFSGIIPGTKWCGTGDIATDYHDLGAEPSVDRCCRAHDLCPVKVRAYSKRYNLTNASLYTKSHCKCDDSLFECLKTSESPTAHIMGNVYFNLIQVPCVVDTKNGRKFRNARNNF